MLGTEDIAGVGAFIEDGSPALGAKEAMLDTELLRVGLPGRAGMNELGDAGNPAEGCRCIGGAVAATEPDMLPVVGVGVGVEWFEGVPVVLMAAGVCDGRLCVARGPVYFSPNSPGAKVTAEQNPSEDVMSSVDPSLDLHRG